MSYSSMAVRFFTTPKALGDSLAEPSDSRSPPSPPKSPDSNAVSLKMTTAPSAHAHTTAASNMETDATAPLPSTSESRGVTFANQDSLPKLPISDLEASCRRYLESLAPLQTPREHEDTKAAVHDFLKSDGPDLQEKLKNYASLKTSFIEQFCECPPSRVGVHSAKLTMEFWFVRV